jgi:hypothetical protein
VERLLELYPAEHEAIVYEASPYPVCAPVVQRLAVGSLDQVEVSPSATLVVPPRDEPEVDREMLERLRRLRS